MEPFVLPALLSRIAHSGRPLTCAGLGLEDRRTSRIRPLKMDYSRGVPRRFELMTQRHSPVHLALILTEFPPSVGGMQTHAEFLAQALHDAGHSICIYTYRCDDPQLAAEAKAFDRHAAYPVRRILSRVGFWANHRLLLEILRQSRVALIYASNVYYGLLGAELGVPVICRSVGNDVQRPWIAYPYRLGSRVVSHPALERTVAPVVSAMECAGMAGVGVPPAAPGAGAAQRARQSDDPGQQRVHAPAVERRSGVGQPQVRVLPGGVDTQRFAPCAGDASGRASRVGRRRPTRRCC